MTWLQRHRIRHYIEDALSILPMLRPLAALLIARSLHWVETVMHWESSFDPETAHFVLGTMAASMFTFIVFISSALLVSVQLASSQLLPRIIALVFRNPAMRFSLALFVFTFTSQNGTVVSSRWFPRSGTASQPVTRTFGSSRASRAAPSGTGQAPPLGRTVFFRARGSCPGGYQRFPGRGWQARARPQPVSLNRRNAVLMAKRATPPAPRLWRVWSPTASFRRSARLGLPCCSADSPTSARRTSVPSRERRTLHMAGSARSTTRRTGRIFWEEEELPSRGGGRNRGDSAITAVRCASS